MSYLNPPYESNFKELSAAMPVFYLDVFEMVEILKAQGRLMDGLCGGFELIIDNAFIDRADAATLKKWEEALGITYAEPLTLEQRRKVVIARIIGSGHIGEPEIRAVVGQYTDAPVQVGFSKGRISLLIGSEVFDEDNLLDTLLRRIPAHLALGVTVEVRREFRQAVDISTGAAIGSKLMFIPAPAAVSAESPVTVSYGGAIGGALRFVPQDPEGVASRIDVVVSHASLEEVNTVGAPAEIHHAVTGTTPKAGGFFYATHIKSKLIG